MGLKECPFCGSSSVKLVCHTQRAGANGLGNPVQWRKWSVRCKRCYARGPIAAGLKNVIKIGDQPDWHVGDEELMKKAAFQWNHWGEYDV